jgi:hypothetical protein
MNTVINIKYGKLIDPFFKDSVLVNYPDHTFPSVEEVSEKVTLFKDEWKKHEEPFMNFLTEKTGLSFKRNIIDCFIVSATPRDMSAPLIIRSRYNPSEFIGIFLHELIHVFLADNKVKKQKGYEDESRTLINHLPVFALLEGYFTEVKQDEEILKFFKGLSGNNPKNIEYKKAWEVVEEKGYQKIIDEM